MSLPTELPAMMGSALVALMSEYKKLLAKLRKSQATEAYFDKTVDSDQLPPNLRHILIPNTWPDCYSKADVECYNAQEQVKWKNLLLKLNSDRSSFVARATFALQEQVSKYDLDQFVAERLYVFINIPGVTIEHLAADVLTFQTFKTDLLAKPRKNRGNGAPPQSDVEMTQEHDSGANTLNYTPSEMTQGNLPSFSSSSSSSSSSAPAPARARATITARPPATALPPEPTMREVVTLLGQLTKTVNDMQKFGKGPLTQGKRDLSPKSPRVRFETVAPSPGFNQSTITPPRNKRSFSKNATVPASYPAAAPFFPVPMQPQYTTIHPNSYGYAQQHQQFYPTYNPYPQQQYFPTHCNLPSPPPPPGLPPQGTMDLRHPAAQGTAVQPTLRRPITRHPRSENRGDKTGMTAGK